MNFRIADESLMLTGEHTKKMQTSFDISFSEYSERSHAAGFSAVSGDYMGGKRSVCTLCRITVHSIVILLRAGFLTSLSFSD